MNNNLQLVLKSSTTEMSLNDHDAGIYIVPELDGLTGLPEIRTTSGVNAGYDGGWTSAQKFDARSIVIRGVIANDDKTEVERMRRELVALLAQGKNEQLELDFVTETGRAYEVQVRTIACDMAMQRVLTQQEFMITLRADDPLIYDNSSAGEEATVNISGATGGFRIPFEIPLAIDAGSEETVVQNSGLESVAPTIKMYGALHNPKIINHTTNQAMQVEAELGFTEGAWTTPVDAPEGTNVSFEPGREAPIESAKLKGDTYQQTYTGKNLMPYPYDGGGLANGITFTANSDGSVTLNGKNNNSGNSSYRLQANIALQAGTYYFIAPSNTDVMFSAYDGSRYYDIHSSNNYTLTLSAATTLQYIIIQVARGKTSQFNNYVVYPMMTTISGQTAADYEPYVGGVPAPNPDYPQAVQTVTGENMVKIHGKNLLYLSGLNATDNGVASTLNNDGSITCSGTVGSGWNGWTIMPYVFNSIQAGTYTLSIDHAINVGMNITFRDSSNTNIVAGNISAGSTSATITLPRTAAKYSLWVNGTTGTAISFTIKAQLEKGSTATTYEPYHEQSYEVNLGKNLFDIAAASDVWINTSGAAQPNAYWKNSDFIKVEPNTTYTISGSTIEGGFPTKQFQYHEYSSDNESSYINQYRQINDVNSATFTTHTGCNYIRVGYRIDALQDIQFEKGSTATSYAAYFEPIELCRIGTYQDYIYKDGSDWKIHKAVGKVVLDGTESWSKVNVSFQSNADATPNKGAVYLDSYSNYFTHHYYSSGITSNLANGEYGWNSAKYLTMRNDSCADAPAFKTWLGSNNTILYYVLATPTDTTITNTALIEQLEALVDGSAVVYEGETHIAVTAAGNMPGITAIRYYTDKEPDQRDELIIDSRLKTITLNGLDVYHLKTDGSEFPMLAPGENKLSLQSDITGDNGYAKVSYKQGYLSI